MPAATDDFSAYQRFPSTPIHAFTVTPDNSTNFTNAARWLFVGSTGNAEIVTLGGETVLHKGLVGGNVYRIACVRVNISNTTATNMVGWY